MREKKRILVYGVSGELYGGIESFLMNMNEHMSSDCVFDYVILGEHCRHTERINARGGKVYQVTSYKKNPIRFVWDSWKVAKAARKDHDAAYFNLFSMCHITAVLISYLFQYRIVLHAHNNNIPNKSKWYHGLHRFCRWILSGMNCIRLTNSEESAVFMFGKKTVAKKKIELIYNAIDVKQFCFSSEIRRRKRKELHLKDEFTVGFAGRLSEQKNPVFLMDIFHHISQKNPDAVFLIAGDGEYRTYMEERADKEGDLEHIRFLGRREDMWELYQAMDCFILPSLFEGLGIVLVEAQASGLHCFASADVIPSMVQISEELMHFISLEKSAQNWADQILEKTAVQLQRQSWNEVVGNSPFQIEKEAKRLEHRLLCGKVEKD